MADIAKSTRLTPSRHSIREFIWPTLLLNFPLDVGTSAMPGPVERQRSLLSDLLERVTLDLASSRIEVRRSGLANLLSSSSAEVVGCSQEWFGFSVPVQLKRRGVEAKLVMHAGGQPSHKPEGLRPTGQGPVNF
jgi:hypothetical protein